MDESVIDRAVYAELRDTTGAEFVAELVDTFIEEGPGMLAELRAARAEGNAERFRRAAHSLKSNGRTFGAVKLTALAREFGLSVNALRVRALRIRRKLYQCVTSNSRNEP